MMDQEEKGKRLGEAESAALIKQILESMRNPQNRIKRGRPVRKQVQA